MKQLDLLTMLLFQVNVILKRNGKRNFAIQNSVLELNLGIF